MNNNHGRRRTRRVRQQRKQQKTQIGRILLTVGLMALIAVVSIGGTIAWLTAQTQEIVNTFASSNVGVTLSETTGNSYKFIPGVDLKKDPTVTAEYDLDAYVFVKVTETDWPDWVHNETDGEGNNISSLKVSYAIDSKWTALDGYDGVYYKELNMPSDTTEKQTTELHVIANDQILVSDTINMDNMTTLNGKNPSLAFKAFIIQKSGSDSAADAWTKLTP